MNKPPNSVILWPNGGVVWKVGHGDTDMFGDQPKDLPHNFGFALLPEFSTMPVAAAIEPLRLANRVLDKPFYRWQMLSQDGKPVRGSNGISIAAEGDLSTLLPHSTVIVCTGVNVHKYATRPVLNWLRKLARQGTDIGALCTGAHILAQAGLLTDYACTIHWENMPGFAEQFPDVHVTGALFEVDRQRFTCAGGTSSIDMMLALIASQNGAELASQVADLIMHSPIRHHSEHQRMSLPARIGARHPKLVQIVKRMEENLEEPISPGVLAKEAGLSTRQLERLFRRYLDRSPKRYYLELRLKQARLLLLQTDMAVINVALACGFSTPSHFSKCYRAFYGRTPYREQAVPSEFAESALAGAGRD